MQNAVETESGQGSVSVVSVIHPDEEPYVLLTVVERREAMPARLSAEDAKTLGLALLGEAKRLGELVRDEDLG